MLGSTQCPKGTFQNIPLKVFFKALTINKRKKKATLKSQRTEQAEPMTQPPAAVQSRVWRPEFGREPGSAKAAAEPGTFFLGKHRNLCSLNTNAERGMETGRDVCQGDTLQP